MNGDAPSSRSSSQGEDLAVLSRRNALLKSGCTVDEAVAIIKQQCLVSVYDMSFKDIYDHFNTVMDLRNNSRRIPKHMDEFLSIYSLRNPLVKTLRHLVADKDKGKIYKLYVALRYFHDVACIDAESLVLLEDRQEVERRYAAWEMEREHDLLFQEDLAEELSKPPPVPKDKRMCI